MIHHVTLMTNHLSPYPRILAYIPNYVDTLDLRLWFIIVVLRVFHYLNGILYYHFTFGSMPSLKLYPSLHRYTNVDYIATLDWMLISAYVFIFNEVAIA
jgi:hypothetical protein